MPNDGLLSQDEIDALLSGTSDLEKLERNEVSEEYLSSIEKDALGEIGNISFGNSATALSQLLNQKVEITTPSVSVVERDALEEEFPIPYVAVVVNYTSGFWGSNLLIVKQQDAAIIADLMLGGDGKNPGGSIDELQLSAVQEAMNQMMGSAATSMSTVFGKRVEISPPLVDILNLPEGEGKSIIPGDDLIVKISFKLAVGNLIDSNIMHILPIKFAKQLVEDLLNDNTKPAEDKGVEVREPLIESDDPERETGMSNSHFHQEKVRGGQAMKKQVQPAFFESFDEENVVAQETRNLTMLYEIPLQVTVELGRTTKTVKEILDLAPGSIIELDKLAGEPVDILINNHLIAKGEVVVIDENFGVRLTEIISKPERIKKMK